MQRWGWLVLAGMALGGGLGARAGANEAPDTQVRLGEIVVLGTRIPNRVKNITSSVDIVDQDRIDSMRADYVMDAIAGSAGVYVRRDGIYGRQDVAIRGLGSNLRRVQTLIDGRPEKMSLFGCTVAQTLPLANAERIEVLRGPESVLYGSDAMGGVINIVTRRRYEPGFEGDASLQYGSYATLHALARHGGQISDFDYYAVYDHKQTDGHRPNNQYNADFGFLRLGGQLNDVWRLEASGQYLADLGHDPGPVSAPYTMNDRRIYRRGSWNASLAGDWLDARALLMAYNNFGEHKFNMPSIEDYWHSRDYTVGAKAEYSMTLLERGDLRAVPTMGYEYQYLWARPQDDWIDWARQNMPARFMNFDEQTQNNHDVYLFNELIWDAWVNTLGLRGHYDDLGEDWELLPHIGLLRHLGDSTTLRAKAARGFRQPRFNELHLFPSHNEDLQPEEVWGYDVGLRQEFGSLMSLEVTPFLQRVSNMIQAAPNADPPPQSVNRNSGAFEIKGLEAAAECRPGGGWLLSAAYTYTDVEDAAGPNPNANRRGVPEHNLYFGAGCVVRKLRLHAEMRYIAGLYDANVLGGGATEKLADHYIVNLRASYPLARHAEVFGGIDNLFDRRYEQMPGYPMPGVTGYAALRIYM